VSQAAYTAFLQRILTDPEAFRTAYNAGMDLVCGNGCVNPATLPETVARSADRMSRGR
jgi:hypothetical protein